jgi:DNA-binding MarR family transcriptional regulator
MTKCAPLPETISYLLAQVCKLHRQRADDLLNEIGLHVGQEMVLCALWEKEGVTQTELGQHLAVQPATVTNALRRLERKGLVERIPDTDDQRVSRVFPTAEGRQRRVNVEEKWDQLERTSFAGFDGPERELLHGLLSRVHENLADQRSELNHEEERHYGRRGQSKRT